MKLLHCYPSTHKLFIRICISLVFVLTLLLVSQGLYPKIAYANYTCGKPDLSGGPHCGSFYRWIGGMNGAKTNINVPFLGGGSSTDGFTNWEIWVQQFNNPSCTFANLNQCWVEAGITDQAGGVLGYYFWADSRPGGSYYNHYPEQVGPDDLTETIQIYKQNNSTWNVEGSVWSCGGGQNGHCSYNWGSQSTNNNMSPNTIDIGMELAGTYGQKGPGSDWQFNYWRCGSNWCKQSGLGNPGSGTSWSLGYKLGPLAGGWNTQPNSSGNTGDWYSYCNC